jgi:hypothetical protein
MGAFDKAGYPSDPGPHLEQWFREAGFVDIHVQNYIIPMGAWPKDPLYVCENRLLHGLNRMLTNFVLQKRVGTWNMIQSEHGFRGAAMAVMTRFESWSNLEVEILAANAVRDLKDRRIHGLFDL